jgi:hypothetical protein
MVGNGSLAARAADPWDTIELVSSKINELPKKAPRLRRISEVQQPRRISPTPTSEIVQIFYSLLIGDFCMNAAFYYSQ